MSSLLRLTSKYGIPHLRRDVINGLAICFPAHLDKWLDIYCQGSTTFNPLSTIQLPLNPHLLECLYLFLDMDLPFLLPALCLRIFETTSYFDICANITRLDALQFILKGRGHLREGLDRTAHLWLDTHLVCRDDACHAVRLVFQSTLSQSESVLQCIVPKDSLKGFLEDRNGLLCEACLANFDNKYHDGVGNFWENLPEYFGLNNWDVLRKQQQKGQTSPI